MAKILVKRSCGHEEIIEVFGKESERQSKIKWAENTPCSECYKAEETKDCKEVKMLYKDYKNEYANCKTKTNSYDKSDKTIIVYVPNETKEEKIAVAIENTHMLDMPAEITPESAKNAIASLTPECIKKVSEQVAANVCQNHDFDFFEVTGIVKAHIEKMLETCKEIAK
jgi:hypothetical protein